MKKRNSIATRGTARKEAPIQPIQPIFSETEIERFVEKLKAVGVLDVLLPFVLIIEDLLRDEDINAIEWQAAADYLVTEGPDEGLKKLMVRVAKAVGEGKQGREAARRAVMHLLEQGYAWDPVWPAFRQTAEPVLVGFLLRDTLEPEVLTGS